MDLSKLSEFQLLHLHKDAKNELKEAKITKIEDDADGAKQKELVNAAETFVKDVIEALGKLNQGNGIQVQASRGIMSPGVQDYELFSLRESLRDALKQFKRMQPGMDINKTVGRLDNVYKITVEPHLTPYSDLEKDFVKGVKLLMSNSMFSQLKQSNESTDSWKNLKAFLMETYGSRITCFQHLSRVWNLEMKDGEKWTDFGARIADELTRASVHIEAMFKAKKNKDMDSTSVFNLMGAMLLSEKLKVKDSNIYGHMVRNMDDHWSADGVAADAQNYADRLLSRDIANPGDEGATFYAGKKSTKSKEEALQKELNELKASVQNMKLVNTDGISKKKKNVCYKWKKTGKCDRKDCKYMHKEEPVGVHFADGGGSDMADEDDIAQQEDYPGQFNSFFQYGTESVKDENVSVNQFNSLFK